MTSSVGSTIFAQRSSMRFWLILVALTGAVAGLGFFSHWLVKKEIRHLVETNLIGTRQLITTAVNTWAKDQIHIADRVVTRKQLQKDLVAALAGDADATLLTLASLDSIATSAQMRWWGIVDAQGTILLAADATQVGKHLPREVPIAEALAGAGHFSPAMRLDELGLPQAHFVACSRFPIAGRDLVLVHAHDPADTFNQLITQATSGESMESYAIDEQGRMLSESRFIEQLKAAGRLPADVHSTIFTLELRNPNAPGSDPANPRSWPLTRFAAAATSKQAGIDLDGGPDYRGEAAIATWDWCPDLHIGIVVKLDRAEAYRALNHLYWLSFALLSLLFLAGVGLAIFLRRTAVLARRARHAEQAIQELGQYQLERKLGEGGMGAVYSATHRLLRRRTAVKLIRGQVDAETLIRFEREVRLCCQLSHPNTIAIYDFGRTNDGVFYYAMEHLSGDDLENLVAKFGPMPPGRVINILVQACGSLGEAHRAKLLHRDIKPANIFLTDRGGIYDFVKVLDFGLVKDLAKTTGATLSKGDVISGTPPYMSPEVIAQKPNLDGRVDLYALALVGIYMLTGRCPFERDNAMDTLMAHLNEPLTSLAKFGSVPADLERVLLSCLAKDPAARPADAEVFAAALLDCADARTWTQKNARQWWEENRQPAAENNQAVDRRLMPTVVFT